MVVVKILTKVCCLTCHKDGEVVQDLLLGQLEVLVGVRLPDQVVSLRLVSVEVFWVDPEHELVLVNDPVLIEVSKCPELKTRAVPLLDILCVSV